MILLGSTRVPATRAPRDFFFIMSAHSGWRNWRWSRFSTTQLPFTGCSHFRGRRNSPIGWSALTCWATPINRLKADSLRGVGLDAGGALLFLEGNFAVVRYEATCSPDDCRTATGANRQPSRGHRVQLDTPFDAAVNGASRPGTLQLPRDVGTRCDWLWSEDGSRVVVVRLRRVVCRVKSVRTDRCGSRTDGLYFKPTSRLTSTLTWCRTPKSGR